MTATQPVRTVITDSMIEAGVDHMLSEQRVSVIIDAIEAREAAIVEMLVSGAEARGYRTQAQQIIGTTGLGATVPEPTPEVEVSELSTDEKLTAILEGMTEIRSTVAGLTQFARNNGYRG